MNTFHQRRSPREQTQFPRAKAATPEKALKLPAHDQQSPFFCLLALIKMTHGAFAQVAKWDIPGSNLCLNHSPSRFFFPFPFKLTYPEVTGRQLL